MAVEALAARRIDVAPLLTERFPIERAAEAFALAADRTRAMKVQIAF
jgi:L-idonate 5-dehydrogenase